MYGQLICSKKKKKSNTFNPSTPRSDQHVTSPYNNQTLSSETGLENIQTYQVKVVISI